MNTVAVISRSFDTVELSAVRDTLGETQAFCARNGIAFQAAAVPPEAGPASPFDFSARNRNRLFRLGERLGASGDAWNLAKPGLTRPPFRDLPAQAHSPQAHSSQS